jgi:predicted metalloprotease with PDZ domain
MKLPAGVTGALLVISTAVPAQRPAVSAPISNIQYTVRYDRQTAPLRQLVVTMSFTVGGRDPVLLSMPSWTPGAYEISDFARDLRGFTVSGQGGTPRWDKLDPDTWRVVPNGATSMMVTFEFLADSMDNAMAWANGGDFAFFNGTNVFLYPEGRPADFSARVTIQTEPEWVVATGMNPEPSRWAYSAPNYHDLVDKPFFIGALEVDSQRIAETWVHTATYPRGILSGAARQRFWNDVAAMIPPMVRVFGEMPPTYTNLILFDSTLAGASALEHENSHVGIYSPFIVGHEFLPSITAHEIFHLWNVKRLRPADMVPYRYDREQPTPWLWVSEGITDYYADVALVRGGVIDSTAFLDLTSGKMVDVNAQPPSALEDLSLSTWLRPTDGTHYLYYQKGSLAGFMLDIMIRDATDNARSLDDVLRSLYQSTYKVGRGFTSQDWWNAVSRAAGGRSFEEFNTKYVDGREPFPWAATLPLAGMRMQVDSIREPWIGIGTQADTAGIYVTQVEPGTAADSAGLQVGDYLRRVGEILVTDPEFGARFRARYSRGDEELIPIEVRREGETRMLSLRLRHRIRTVERAVFDRNASPKAVRIRSGILRGTTGQ